MACCLQHRRQDAWNFDSSSVNESTLRALCEQVDDHFQLPDRFCRFFAATEDEYLASEVGQYYRGVQFPASGTDEVCLYVRGRYFPPDSTTYDHLLYIRASTCLDPTGCVVTYAHELQHLVQHSRFPRLMKATSVLRGNIRVYKTEATEIDIPAEVDANIVSKQIAETVCGVEPVRRFAEEQLRFMRNAGETAQEVRWEYFLNTPSSTSYDFVEETLKLVRQYKRLMHFEMDVDAPDWWKGPADKNHLSRTW
jgi:hypothetical protein